MTMHNLNRANGLIENLNKKVAQLNKFERGHIKSITFSCFNEELGIYEDFVCTKDIPRANIKTESIRVLREEIRILQQTFEKIGTPKVEMTVLAN